MSLAVDLLTFGIVAILAGLFSKFMISRGKTINYIVPLEPESQVLLAAIALQGGVLLAVGSGAFLAVMGLTDQPLLAVVVSCICVAIGAYVYVSRDRERVRANKRRL